MHESQLAFPGTPPSYSPSIHFPALVKVDLNISNNQLSNKRLDMSSAYEFESFLELYLHFLASAKFAFFAE